MKRYLYMIFLILISVLFSWMFSFAGADRFFFYTFFFFISSFLCGLKPMPVLALFCAGDWLLFRSDGIHIFMLFVFVVATCMAYRKIRVYASLLAGYIACLVAGVIFALFAEYGISIIFDKMICYLTCFVFAPPFVFALRRAGIVNRKKVRY